MAQLTDDCFAFSGPLLPIADMERLITERVTPVAEAETVSLVAARGRVIARDVVPAPSTASPRRRRHELRLSPASSPHVRDGVRAVALDQHADHPLRQRGPGRGRASRSPSVHLEQRSGPSPAAPR